MKAIWRLDLNVLRRVNKYFYWQQLKIWRNFNKKVVDLLVNIFTFLFSKKLPKTKLHVSSFISRRIESSHWWWWTKPHWCQKRRLWRLRWGKARGFYGYNHQRKEKRCAENCKICISSTRESFDFRRSLRKKDLFSVKSVMDSEVFGLLGSLKKTWATIQTNTQRQPFGSLSSMSSFSSISSSWLLEIRQRHISFLQMCYKSKSRPKILLLIYKFSQTFRLVWSPNMGGPEPNGSVLGVCWEITRRRPLLGALVQRRTYSGRRHWLHFFREQAARRTSNPTNQGFLIFFITVLLQIKVRNDSCTVHQDFKDDILSWSH